MTRVDGAVSGCADSWWSGRRFARAMVMSAILAMAVNAHAQTDSFEVYGFGQADAILDFNTNDPKWYDVNRPSRLPKFHEEFGEDGHFYLSTRQSRLGARGEKQTDSGPVKGQFEFDMFGVGADAGQTTIRLRHAWGQWKQFGAGQTNSQFMDIDIFPNVVDYWGPNGMLFFRNVQIFWRPIEEGQKRVTVAIENPGASGDGGIYADRIELQNVKARFPLPDLTGNFRVGKDWGHLQLSGILRQIQIDDLLDDQFDLGDSVIGFGISLSSVVNMSKGNALRLQYTYGEGIQNYFNDAPVDVAVKQNPGGDPRQPIIGEALPIQGIVLWLDHPWNSQWTTSAGYSRVDIWNSNGQAANAYKAGQYIGVNLLSTPAPNVMMGGELQWGQRENNSDGFSSSDFRIQFTMKYSFSAKIGG